MTAAAVVGDVLGPAGWWRPGAVVWEGPRITWAGPLSAAAGLPAAARDLRGCVVAPGFIDLHVHGGGGADAMAGEPEAIHRLAAFHARHGTTALLATTVTADRAALLRAAAAVAAAAERPGEGAAVLGLHLEGPYLNPARAGAQRGDLMRDPDAAEVAELTAAARGRLRLLTLAPERPGALALIRDLTARGVRVAVGHSDATAAAVAAAVAAGARHVCHLFNAMRGLHHREPGVVGAALATPDLTLELIADGVHVAPAVMRLAVRSRGAGAFCLVTDAIAAAGCGDGTWDLGGLPVEVRDGVARLADGTLAGSLLTMDRGVATLVGAVGLLPEEALAMASRNPARALGLPGKGLLAAGRDADLVVLDGDWRVRLTVVGGRVVYDAV